MAFLTPTQNLWLLSVVFLAVLLLLGLLFRRSIGQVLAEYRIRQAVSRLGKRMHRDLLVPDGLDGYVAADYVVLTHKGILVVKVNHFDGNIFGGRDTDQWSQVTRGASHRFDNPLHEIQLICATLRSQVPNTPISGIVLFAGDCRFPKDKPPGACLLEELPKKPRRQQIPPRLDTAWELFLLKARQLAP
ncbi:MAG: NERD domain-containing protein [Sedimenticola sp.]|nr:NERD domain-containing protein [Sedimenticola sp.]